MNYNYSLKRFKDLVALCVWKNQNVATTSLTQLSNCLEPSTEVFINSEGLNQRFNKANVQFSQHILAELLNQKFASSMPISSPFPSYTERHPRATKNSNLPVQPPTAKRAN